MGVSQPTTRPELFHSEPAHEYVCTRQSVATPPGPRHQKVADHRLRRTTTGCHFGLMGLVPQPQYIPTPSLLSSDSLFPGAATVARSELGPCRVVLQAVWSSRELLASQGCESRRFLLRKSEGCAFVNLLLLRVASCPPSPLASNVTSVGAAVALPPPRCMPRRAKCLSASTRLRRLVMGSAGLARPGTLRSSTSSSLTLSCSHR